MRQYIEDRVLEIASYTLETESTVRATAKSTVYKDVAERLPKINPQLAEQIRKLLAKNTELRSVNGGEATKQKYLKLKN